MSEDSGALRTLLALFKIEVDGDDIEKGEKLVDEFKEKLLGFGEAIGIAFGAHEIKEFIEHQIEAGAALGHTSEMLGVSVGEFEAFTYAVRSAGGSAESATGALRFLSRNMAAAAQGSAKQAQAFAAAGINVRDASGQMRPALDVMADLADVMQKSHDPAAKVGLAMDVLGRAGAQMIPALNKGGESFRKAREEMEELGGGLGKEFTEQAKLAEEGLVGLDTASTGLKRQIMMELLPGVIKLIEGAKDLAGWLVQTEKKSHILSDAFTFLKVGAVVVGIWQLVGALKALTVQQLIAVVTNPFVLWVVGIGLALLAYNDLKTALIGGKSVFGDIFGQTGIKELREDVDEATDAVDVLVASVGTLWDFLKGVADIVGIVGSKFSSMAHHANAGIARVVRKVTGAAENDADREEDEVADQADERTRKYQEQLRDNQASTGNRWAEVDKKIMGREDARIGVTGAVGTPGGGTSGPIYNPMAGRRAPTFTYGSAPKVPIPSMPGNGGVGAHGATVINQHNPVSVEIHTNDPEAVVKPIKSAVATANQIDMSNGKQSVRRP